MDSFRPGNASSGVGTVSFLPNPNSTIFDFLYRTLTYLIYCNLIRGSLRHNWLGYCFLDCEVIFYLSLIINKFDVKPLPMHIKHKRTWNTE